MAEPAERTDRALLGPAGVHPKPLPELTPAQLLDDDGFEESDSPDIEPFVQMTEPTQRRELMLARV